MNKTKKRPKIGVFSFTCCEGCSIVFVELLNKKFFEYREKLDIKNFRVLKTNDKIESLDLAIVEGAISTEEEKKKLLEIRRKSLKVLAIGSCAITGLPSGQRNNFSSDIKEKVKPLVEKLEQLEVVSPVSKFIKVDLSINGCPINQADLEKVISGVINDA